MSLLDLIVAALAVWQVVEVWHHGAIFDDWQAQVELWRGGFNGWAGQMLTCPWCTSIWIGFLVCGNLMLAAMVSAPWIAFFPYALAASRLANLGNDLSHAWCRTPKATDLPAQEGDDKSAIGVPGGPR